MFSCSSGSIINLIYVKILFYLANNFSNSLKVICKSPFYFTTYDTYCQCFYNLCIYYFLTSNKKRPPFYFGNSVGGYLLTSGTSTALFIKERGYAPTIREITEIVGLKSSSTVYEQLKQLEDKGYILMEPFKSRTIKILKNE